MARSALATDELHLPWSFWSAICMQPSVIQRIFVFLVCLQFWRWALKAIFAGHFRGVLNLFELVFVLRDTFCATWNKERRRRSIKLFWTTLFYDGASEEKNN